MHSNSLVTDDLAADLSTGYGTEHAMAVLTRKLLASRAFLLRVIVAEIATLSTDIDTESGLSEAYRVLSALQQSCADEVDELLTYPHTGLWIGWILERIQVTSTAETIPLWADCGYLGWLAAAGCVTCLPHGSTRLVVRDGVVVLPRIGMARLDFPGFCGHCDMAWGDGAVHFTVDNIEVLRVVDLDDESNPAWLPFRRVQVPEGGRQIIIDDLDPFRALDISRPLPPRLTLQETLEWQRNLTAAWQLLHTEAHDYVGPLRGCLRMLAPLTSHAVPAPSSHTADTGVGCVYTTAPADHCQLALTLVHEIQHTKLALLLDQVMLFDPDSPRLFYAPWRDDPRPITGLAQGIYAFFGVTDFWRVHRYTKCHDTTQSHIEFELSRIQLIDAIVQADTSGLLTAIGKQFMTALAVGTRSWAEEEVPAEARHAVTQIRTAHRTFWRVRNLAPDRALVSELATSWATKAPRPLVLPPVRFTNQELIPNRYRRLGIAAQLRHPGVAEATSPSGHPRGDHAYLAGELAEAVDLYLEELRTDPLRPQIWAGLALALPKRCSDDDFGILAERAELAAALYERVSSCDQKVDPIALLRWLSDIDQAQR
ncbi:HEXXH motif domain-containing protein [Nocardia sp. NPDC004260]